MRIREFGTAVGFTDVAYLYKAGSYDLSLFSLGNIRSHQESKNTWNIMTHDNTFQISIQNLQVNIGLQERAQITDLVLKRQIYCMGQWENVTKVSQSDQVRENSVPSLLKLCSFLFIRTFYRYTLGFYKLVYSLQLLCIGHFKESVDSRQRLILWLWILE